VCACAYLVVVRHSIEGFNKVSCSLQQDLLIEKTNNNKRTLTLITVEQQHVLTFIILTAQYVYVNNS
jgi:hypothetical protein